MKLINFQISCTIQKGVRVNSVNKYFSMSVERKETDLSIFQSIQRDALNQVSAANNVLKVTKEIDNTKCCNHKESLDVLIPVRRKSGLDWIFLVIWHIVFLPLLPYWYATGEYKVIMWKSLGHWQGFISSFKVEIQDEEDSVAGQEAKLPEMIVCHDLSDSSWHCCSVFLCEALNGLPGFRVKGQLYVRCQGCKNFRRIDLKSKSLSLLQIGRIHDDLSSGGEYLLTQSQRELVESLDGSHSNTLSILPESHWSIRQKIIAHPFYFLQFLSLLIWFWQQNYVAFGLAIMVASILSIGLETFLIHRYKMMIRKEIERFADTPEGDKRFVRVVDRAQESLHTREIESRDLVRGDIVLLTMRNETIRVFLNDDASSSVGVEPIRVPADLQILDPDIQCLVDESILNGQSQPVTKGVGETLFAGTRILGVQCVSEEAASVKSPSLLSERKRNLFPVFLAIVQATGFNSRKGELYRFMLNAGNPNINKESYSYIAVMGILALSVLVYRLFINGFDGIDLLECIAAIVPPILPIVLSLQTSITLYRLYKFRIVCTDPGSINFAGKTDLICLDKTGTLTKESLDFDSMLVPNEEKTDFSRHEWIRSLSDPNDLELCILACHSLIPHSIEHSATPTITPYCGVLGNALERSMFSRAACRTYWHISYDYWDPRPFHKIVIKNYEDPTFDGLILKRFNFDPVEQTSIGIVSIQREPNRSYELKAIIKGSWEKIAQHCPESSISLNCNEQCIKYSSLGYYVLAVASCNLPDLQTCQSIKCQSDLVGRNFSFCGFFLFNNQIKEESVRLISDLQEKNIRTVIVTGDGVYTAINNADEAGLLKQPNSDFFNPILVIEGTDIKPGNKLQVTCVPSKNAGENRTLQAPLFIGDPEQVAELLSSTLYSEHKLVVTGQALGCIENSRNLLHSILKRTVIFGRMDPNQKSTLIKLMEKHGIAKSVMMCGDGSNDYKALKTASVGVSFSYPDTSFAASFYSLRGDLLDISRVLEEGSSFLESFNSTIFFLSLCTMIRLSYSGSANQYLLQDIFLVLFPALLHLLQKPPSTSQSRNMSLVVILGGILINSLFSFVNWQILISQPWFFCSPEQEMSSPNSINPYQCDKVISFEATFSWLFANFQLINSVAALLFLDNRWKRNPLLTAWIIVSYFICTSILISSGDSSSFSNWIRITFNLRTGGDGDDIPLSYRASVFALSVFNLLLLLLWQKFMSAGNLSVKYFMDSFSYHRVATTDEELLLQAQ